MIMVAFVDQLERQFRQERAIIRKRLNVALLQLKILSGF